MAIQIIGNQPVSIVLGSDFNAINEDCTQANRDFCQTVRPGDTTMFQMIQSENTGVNLISNQPFPSELLPGWESTPPNQWLWAPELGAFTKRNNVSLTTNPSIVIDPNVIYRIKFDVTVADAGSNITLVLFPNSGTLDIWGTGATPIGQTGTFTAFVRASTGTAINISFLTVTTGRFIGINNIELICLTEPVITIQDSLGNTVLSVTDLEYYENFIQAKFDWPDIAEGTYNICVEGIEDLSKNFLLASLCLGLENQGELLQENGECIKWIG